ncbi:MAG TPA: ABC transporter substrate-binding protein [Chloroflexota bacterium]|nr:ABC transporter substrate-binding protein [Chloroflexota bacterium]
MLVRRRARFAGLVLALLFAGCAGDTGSARTSTSPNSTSVEPPSAAPKRIIAGVMGVHSTANSKTIGPGRPPGFDALEALVSAGVANADDHGNLRPQLAEAVPSVDNGLWTVEPDGRMQTTWKLKSTALWQDGVPVTTDDLLLTADVSQDPDLPNFRDSSAKYIESMDARDAQTLVVHWKRPFIGADSLFTDIHIVPLPAHILRQPYEENKANFLELPYWRDEFVGSGPFKVREWQLGTKVVLEANDRYVLGRPKVDAVEVRFIPDPNALVANVLSGEIELTMGRGLSLEQTIQVRDEWRNGKPDVAYDSWIAIYPQMLNPTPSVILDARFRRAMLEAIDRQEMVETIQHGLVPVADTILAPTEPEYPAVESSIVRYPFDVALAAQGLEALGYSRGPDGWYRSSDGERLAVQIRSTPGDVQQKGMISVADYWQRIGVAVETVEIPPARANDRPYRYTRPGFELQRQPNAPEDIERYHSAQAPVPENNFTGTSKSRYMNADLDALIDAFFATIPTGARVSIFAQIVHHISDQVVPLPLFYDANAALVGNRLQNVAARHGRNSTEAWNAELWDVSSQSR